MNYYDLFTIDKERIESIINRSRYCNQIHFILIFVINQKIICEKQYIIDHPIYPVYNKPNNRSEIRKRRWSLDSFNSSSNSSGENTPISRLSLSNISFISNDDEYECMEEYLNGLINEHIIMIAKYYNIYFKNRLITHLLYTKTNTIHQQTLMVKWIYVHIERYIFERILPIHLKFDKQIILEKYMEQQLHLQQCKPSTEEGESSGIREDVKSNNQIYDSPHFENNVILTNKPYPSVKITLSQRIYRILSKSWRCFSIIMFTI